MSPRRSSVAVLALIVAALCAWTPTGAAAASAPVVRLTGAFDRDARLGAPTSLTFALDVEPGTATAPLSEVNLLYPASLGITTSGLGVATCRRPAGDFERVLIDVSSALAGCPANAVMGYGSVRADVRLGTQAILATAGITVLSGPFERGRLRLVAFVDGLNPLGFKLVYAGSVDAAPAPFGGNLAIRMPTIPDLPADASVALVHVDLTLGSKAITYRDESGGTYHPEGIGLPDRCPRGGFPFRARLRFEDGARTTANATLRCPPRAVARR